MLPCLPLSPSRAVVHSRRRGIWKGRETPKREQTFDSDDDRRPAKRHRSEDSSDADSDDSCYAVQLSNEIYADEKIEDWEDLKELFSRATEQYECDKVSECLQLLRGVIRHAHRFLLLYQDPSMLYAEPRGKKPGLSSLSPSSHKPRKKCTCKESPTAFHAILGTTLFLFGNLVAQDASFALADEPSTFATYWLAALDVFEIGENLPSRTSGRGCEAPEDWRMHIIWGRTLLCVADAALTLQQQQNPSNLVTPPEPKWSSPAASPFAAIAMRRLPVSRRISLASAVPHDLLLLAMDHFSRGIFHMPHTLPVAAPPLPSPPKRTHSQPSQFDRAAELFTIAREVLALAERLPAPAERMRWALWADSVLNKIPAQAQTAVVARARARCWFVASTARVEDIGVAAETRGRGGGGVPDSEEAEDARKGLERAVGYFEIAMSERVDAGGVKEEERDEALRACFAESLLTLANLTEDEDKREALCLRARLLGSDGVQGMKMDHS
ncbi:hypothetical protein GGX14DRAFT_583716 [Mycena pura]|uniref:Uncharacterized protein n=1 Tax=Mycena pura TaxID=153505 RepID=A0AAD6YVF8_9AGAR|nr:hypothetical protein GGX14DRAFT_583716 [Mycena pura]